MLVCLLVSTNKFRNIFHKHLIHCRLAESSERFRFLGHWDLFIENKDGTQNASTHLWVFRGTKSKDIRECLEEEAACTKMATHQPYIKIKQKQCAAFQYKVQQINIWIQ